MTVVLFAEQLAVVPPFRPPQVQVQGPDPLTAEAVPALHKLALGALPIDAPFAEPQAPLVAGVFVAEQFAVAPPLLPVQVQAQGPLAPPCTAVALPTLQRLLLGADAKTPLLEEPQTPLTAGLYARQLAVEPPPEPAQLQVQVLPLATADAEPALQRPVDGAVAEVMPFEGPQEPFTG